MDLPKTIDNIYQIGSVYVEIEPLPEWHEPLNNEEVFVCTRHLYNNSMFGQIETCGIVKIEQLQALKDTKKNRQIVEQIHSIRKTAEQRSEIWYNLEKAKEMLDNTKENNK